jgi:phosphate transport system substrate-binding protein
MAARRARQLRLSVVGFVPLCALAFGCRQQPAPSLSAPATLTGQITINGSDTLLPVSRTLADAFQRRHSGVKVTVGASGTGEGFRTLCAGELDIAGASRPINAAEAQGCRLRGIEFFELPLAFDSLSVVVSPRNLFASCLTVAELRRMWEPAADGKVTRWRQVRSSFPDQTLELFGPGKGSGTFDYFTLAINGVEGSSRSDYTRSEDHAELAGRVAADPNALGYLPYAYYLSSKDRLKLVAVDGGEGCVTPSAESVAGETYQPLSRPIFIYVAAAANARPEVRALARDFLSPDNASTIQEIGYVPLPTATLLSLSRHLDRNLTGSIFGGRGSVLGVTAARFEDDDRLKNELVR